MLVPGITGSLMERLIHSRQGTSPQLLAWLRFCVCFSKTIKKKNSTATHSFVLFKIKKKKRNKSELKPLKGKGEVSLGEENAAFKEGTEATARETLPLQGLSWRVECV